MHSGKIEIKRRVWIGLIAALTVIGLWWATARMKPGGTIATTPTKPPFVRLAGMGMDADDVVLREQAELMDPTPLFFPTGWNYGQRPLVEKMRRQPGQIFESFGEKITFGEQAIKTYGIEAVIAPERLADMLVQGNEAPFAGMGQIDVHRPVLSKRSGFLEIRRLSSGLNIIAQSLTEISPPRPDYAPMEFLALVSSAGLIGDPVLVSGSGWEEVDSFFRSYLVKTFRLGERLDPGRYRVVVGP